MDTRTAILNAAVQVFSQHGFRGSTTRRIADAAEVNEVTIFRYFGSKEALLQEAINSSESRSNILPLPHDPVDPERELSDWAGAVVAHLKGRRGVIRKCMGEIEERPELTARAAEFPTRATHELCTYFDRLKDLGFTRDEFNPTVASAMFIASLFHDAMSREMMPEIFPEPEDTAPASYARMVLRAIGVKRTSAT
ncbi:MAG TPA: helix-turn-helix domain-containing protein [Gemmatimonadaceae bacterium]|jgi:AcrR family transcriptional regulator|nr:helix-turn-helix domain-containing protein [Gemmatimonadaceae bacterium]